MERTEEKHERKFSRRSFKSKSATLPSGAVLMDQPGEGFFSKIRRSFKIRKKNKFVVQRSLDDAEASDGVGPASLTQSTDSLKTMNAENSGMKGRFRFNKASQETNCAKQNVVLVSSKTRRSSGTPDWTPSAGETMPDDTTKTSQEKDHSQSKSEEEPVAEASAKWSVTEDNNNDKYLDDFDPDYETLDNIRQKLRSQSQGESNCSTAKAGADVAMAGASEKCQHSASNNTGGKEQDSGLTRPVIGFPKENQTHSVVSSLGSGCRMSSDGFEQIAMNVREAANGIPGDGHNGISNSQTLVSAFEDDLYANAKVLMRKQLRKSVELSPAEVAIDQSRSVLNARLSDKFKDMKPTETTDCVVPPPLPARNYSEKDIMASHTDTACADLNQEQTSATIQHQSNTNTSQPQLTLSLNSKDRTSRMKSEMSDSDRVVSNTSRRDSAFIEVGPVVTLSSDQQRNTQGNNYNTGPSNTQITLPCSESSQTLLTSSNSAQASAMQTLCGEEVKLQNVQEKSSFKDIESELLFIDEDPVEDCDIPLKGTGRMDCARGTGTYKTPVSNLVCKHDTADKVNAACKDDTMHRKNTADKVNAACKDDTMHRNNTADKVNAACKDDIMHRNNTTDRDDSGQNCDIAHRGNIAQGGGGCHDSIESKGKTEDKSTDQHSASTVVLKGAQKTVEWKSENRDKQEHQRQREPKQTVLNCGSPIPDSGQSREDVVKTVPQTSNQTVPQASNQTISQVSDQTILQASNQTILQASNQTISQASNQTILQASNQISLVSYNSHFAPPSVASFPPPFPRHAASGATKNKQKSKKSDKKDKMPKAKSQCTKSVQCSLSSPVDETPPPVPPFRVNRVGTAERKVVSEELPLRHDKDTDLESQKSRRHSSPVDTCRAQSDFMKSMKQLKECGWYWGPLSSDEAVSMLTDKCEGSFLVRDSSSDKYLLTISFKYNNHVHHTRIEFHKGLFSFWEKPDEHSKAHICQFIEQTVEHSRKGNYIYFQRTPNSSAPPLPIQLLYPVSRFYRVPSLQHICRFLILCRVRIDLIDELPLPQKVKAYLSEKQYYVEMLTED